MRTSKEIWSIIRIVVILVLMILTVIFLPKLTLSATRIAIIFFITELIFIFLKPRYPVLSEAEQTDIIEDLEDL